MGFLIDRQNVTVMVLGPAVKNDVGDPRETIELLREAGFAYRGIGR